MNKEQVETKREQLQGKVKAKWAATVLLVDDDLGTIGALRRALRAEPYYLMFTDDPFQALEWIKSEDIDLIITDEFMPGMLGTELLDGARHISSGTRTILLSAYLKPAVACRGSEQRVDLMLAKPWNDNELREAVRYILQKRDRKAKEPPQ